MKKKIFIQNNTNSTKDEARNSMPKKAFKGAIINAKNALQTFIIFCITSAMTLSASATGGGAGGSGSGDMWAEIVGFISTWIPRLGGAIIVIGLIMFGLGWQRDDADGKSRGIQVTIGGAIVAAVGGMTSIFMA